MFIAYGKWAEDKGFYARYECPECSQIFSTRPIKNIALTNICSEFRQKFFPEEIDELLDWDDDDTWFALFPALMAFDKGETAVFSSN